MNRGRLSSEQIGYLHALIDNNNKQQEIINRFQARFGRRISPPTITYHRNIHVRSRHQGRPKKTTQEQDFQMLSVVRANPWKSWRHIAKMIEERFQIEVSSRTLRRRMSKYFSLKSYVAKHKPKITPALARQRLEFAQEYVIKPDAFFDRLILGDEARINLNSNEMNKLYVKRLANEGLHRDKVKGQIKFRGGGSGISFWLTMSSAGPGLLLAYEVEEGKTKMTGRQYRDDILEDNLFESAGIMGLGNNFTFLEDRDPAHTSNIVTNWYRDNGINFIHIPGNSPDLNPVENLINKLKREVFADQNNYRSLEDLREGIFACWNNLSNEPDLFRNLIGSFKKRCRDIIQNGGYNTKY